MALTLSNYGKRVGTFYRPHSLSHTLTMDKLRQTHNSNIPYIFWCCIILILFWLGHYNFCTAEAVNVETKSLNAQSTGTVLTNHGRRGGESMEHKAASTFPSHGPSVSMSWPVLTGVLDDNNSHSSHVYILRIENILSYFSVLEEDSVCQGWFCRRVHIRRSVWGICPHAHKMSPVPPWSSPLGNFLD